MITERFWQSAWGKELQQPATWLAVAFLAVFIVTAFSFNHLTANFQNFVYQADGFLHGSVFYHTLPPTLHDSSVVGGWYFWAPGPLPALLLLPLVAAFGLAPLQVYLSMALTMVVVCLAWRLARQARFSRSDSLWLALGFTFASIYLGVAFRAQAWQVSSAVAAAAVLLMLLEWRARNRPWLVGLAAAAALATRFTAGLVLLLPLVDILLSAGRSRQQKIHWVVWAIVPVAVVGVLLLSLNYARTGSLWDTGYRSAQVSAPLAEVRAKDGLFSLRNIPTNVFFYFLVPPRPVFEPGTYRLQPPYVTANIAMGFFFLSPIFLYLWRLRGQDTTTRLIMFVAAGMTLLILSYYALNAWEFGPRYLTDVLPLYYLLLLTCFSDSKLIMRDRVLIALSAIFNLYLFTAIPWWSGT